MNLQNGQMFETMYESFFFLIYTYSPTIHSSNLNYIIRQTSNYSIIS